MLVSVIIPTIRKKSLEKVLPAVLEQEFPRDQYEVLVIEDGTASGVEDLVASFAKDTPSLRYYWKERGGPAGARNYGVSKALGEIVVFLDDDTLPPRNWLSSLVSGFKKYPQAVAVGGFMEAPAALVRSNPFARFEAYQTHVVYKAGTTPVLSGFDCPAGGSNNLAYRKNVFEKFGGFDESFPFAAGEDADLKKRITDAGHKFLYLPIKVEHLQDYTWDRFIRQSLVRGRGAVLFERKHGGWRGIGGLFLGLIYIPLSLARNLVRIPDKSLVFLYLVQDLVMWYGRLREILSV